MALLHFNRDLDRLRNIFLRLFALVDENLGEALQAFRVQDGDMAARIVARDEEIDRMEVEVEEACLKILALHQPVSQDLRYLAALLKINRNLERVGDQAVTIARSVITLREHPVPDLPDGITRMMDLSVDMMKEAFDALIRLDVDTARKVWNDDDEADELAMNLIRLLRGRLRESPERADVWVELYSLVHILERVCDHATNIAKDVIYTVQGEIVRHRGRDFKRV